MLAATAAQAANEHGTADWARANLARLEGTRITLEAGSCEPGSIEGDEQRFTIDTYSKDGFGGSIMLVVPVAQAPALFTRIGSNRQAGWDRWRGRFRVKTSAVSGFLRQGFNGVTYLDLRPEQKHAATATAEGKIRTWTSTDGRTVEAEFLSANTVTVRIRRVSDGQVFTLELAKLAPEDRAWVAAQ